MPVVRRGFVRLLASAEWGELQIVDHDGTVRTFGTPGAQRSATMTVHNPRAWHRLASRGQTGFGEGFVAGDWSADDLPTALEIIARAFETRRQQPPIRQLQRIRTLVPKVRIPGSVSRARREIEYHYDLGNDFYELILGSTMAYSSAVFEGPDDDLDAAQERKLDRICRKLHLTSDDHLLELGCGWGGLAIHAARHYGARVTAVTLSPSQCEYAQAKVRSLGLEQLVEVRLQDYRTLRGTWSKVAAVEMVEAGSRRRDYPSMLRTIDELLAPDGLACLQIIALQDRTYAYHRRVEGWLRRYVFPGSLSPSVAHVCEAAARSSSLMVYDLEELVDHYARTLQLWRQRFFERIDTVRALGFSREFERAWEYYLGYCEAGYRSRITRDVQIVLTRAMNDSIPRTLVQPARLWRDDEPAARASSPASPTEVSLT
jgi:cyclopropane-fatty-acyl-phospholipid synthase